MLIPGIKRRVYNEPQVATFILAILSVYKYFLGKKVLDHKKYLGKTFFDQQDICVENI